jgi:hypothetical protein
MSERHQVFASHKCCAASWVTSQPYVHAAFFHIQLRISHAVFYAFYSISTTLAFFPSSGLSNAPGQK